MKVLLIDPHGDALDWGVRIHAHGHELRHFIRDSDRTCHIGVGLVPLVRDFRPLEWADLIILADNKLYMKEIDAFRKWKPYARIVGGTQESCSWELDRKIGCKVLESNGIPVIPYKLFTNYDDAIRYVKAKDERVVSKPCGDADKALSYVSGGPDPVADMVYMLTKWKKEQKLNEPFIIQDHVDGIEMAADGWFGPGGFDHGWSESFEFKKLMPGNYGVNTGEMGTVLRFTPDSLLARTVLEPLAEALEACNYCGYVSVNCIIDGKGIPWPLEFTMRPGYPTINVEQEIHGIDDPAERLMALVSGDDCRSIALDEISCGVVVAGKGYPNPPKRLEDIDGLPIFGCESVGDKHLHPCQVQCDSDYDLVTAGDYNLVITGSGKTVSDARDLAYKRVKKIHIPGGICVRDDIGERLEKELPRLHKMGYAEGMEY